MSADSVQMLSVTKKELELLLIAVQHLRVSLTNRKTTTEQERISRLAALMTNTALEVRIHRQLFPDF